MYSSAAPSIHATPKLMLMILIVISPCIGVDSRDRRVVPYIQNCDPTISDVTNKKKCLKGDWIDPSIADCEKTTGLLSNCNPQFPRDGIWVVELPEPLGGCREAQSSKPINCTAFPDSRCVCSSNPDAYYNHCKCQYWPNNGAPGTDPGSVCYGYQQDGHQWACCHGVTNCGTHTWQIESQSQDRCTDQGSSRVRETYLFNCGDCTCLRKCSAACDNIIKKKFGTASSERCGAWLTCFRGCCVKAFTGQDVRSHGSLRKRQSDNSPIDFEFCGDTRCNVSNNENSSTCPEDCCQEVNPSCAQSGDTCAADCCQKPSCCSSTSPAACNAYAPGILLSALLFTINT